jgi:hypothetical protein
MLTQFGSAGDGDSGDCTVDVVWKHHSMEYSFLHEYVSESLHLWTSSIVEDSKCLEDSTFQKVDLFLSSGEGTAE